MEETLPPQTQNGAGFESTRVRQLTVFVENRVGRLQALVRAYEAAGGRVLGLSIQDTADTALVRLICSDVELAHEVLGSEGFAFTEQDVLIVELPRSANPLTTLCAVLLSAEINIHYAYPLMIRPRGPAMALYLEDIVLASQLMMRKNLTILSESDLRRAGQ